MTHPPETKYRVGPAKELLCLVLLLSISRMLQLPEKHLHRNGSNPSTRAFGVPARPTQHLSEHALVLVGRPTADRSTDKAPGPPGPVGLFPFRGWDSLMMGHAGCS